LEGQFDSQDRIKIIYDIFFKTKEKWKEHHSEYINQKKEVHEKKKRTRPRTFSKINEFEVLHPQPISNVLQPDKIRDV